MLWGHCSGTQAATIWSPCPDSCRWGRPVSLQQHCPGYKVKPSPIAFGRWSLRPDQTVLWEGDSSLVAGGTRPCPSSDHESQ